MRADLGQLVELVEQLTRCATHLESVEHEVGARTDRLHVTWRGEAATLHTAAHRRWCEAAREARHALAALHAVAHQSGDNYDAARHANAEMWST